MSGSSFDWLTESPLSAFEWGEQDWMRENFPRFELFPEVGPFLDAVLQAASTRQRS